MVNEIILMVFEFGVGVGFWLDCWSMEMMSEGGL